MKVLIVDPDAARASTLGDALAASAAQPAVAPSASFALTMLEWNQQDVIISRANVGDMDGHELCAFVRADPSTKSVKFVLIANDVTPVQATQIGIDLVIPEGLVGQAIVTRVTHLMRRDAEPSPTATAENGLAALASAAGVGLPASANPSPVAPPPAPPTPIGTPPQPVAPLPPPAPVVAAPPAVPPTTLTPPALAPAPAAPPRVVPPPAASTTGTPSSVAPTPASPPTAAPPAAAPGVAPPAPGPALKGAAPPSPPLTELEAVGLNGAMRTFQGALGSLTLADLAKALAARSKTGRLLLVMGTGGGMIAFDSGRIVHAEIGNTTGETAFQTLVTASHRERGGKFCFIPSDPRDLANVPKTITRTVPDLLLGAAKAMDEEK